MKMNKQQVLENERENFRNLFRQTPEMVCILHGPEHLFEFVNEAHVKVLGFDATGMTVREAQPESVEVHSILDEVYQTGITAQLHEIPVTVTNRLRYFNLTYAARRDEDQKINGIMILGIEITEQVLLRNQERESQEQLKFALASGNMGAWIVNLVTNKVTMSDSAYGIFGFSREYQNADAAIDTFIHPDDREHAREVFINSITRKLPYADEYRILRPNGEVRWVRLKGRAQFDGETPIMLSGVVMDVTEEKHNQEALENAVKIRDEFISIASHELRTPVTSMQLQTQLLQRIIEKSSTETISTKRLQNTIELSQRKLNQMIHLISDMLDVSKIASGKLEVKLSPVCLNDIAKEIISRFENELTLMKIKLQFKETQNVIVMADSFRLDQVITNLLSNAIKYGHGKPIQVEIFQEKSMGCFAIADEGPGIAEENHAKIFERFERVTSESNIGGLGLGLYISRDIIKAHHGIIELSSKLGEGARFLIKLPLN
jgi:PAS domain S-box-containing protein